MNIPKLERQKSIKHREKIEKLKAMDEGMLTKVIPDTSKPGEAGLLIPHGYLHPGKCKHSEVKE